ncbi:MAG: formylglycine-generating enzyme family protein [bacterium]
MQRQCWWLVVVLAGGLWACDDDVPPMADGRVDQGRVRDMSGGDTPDEGVEADDGVDPDDGVEADRGIDPDDGVERDMAVEADEGVEADMSPMGCEPGTTSRTPCRALMGVCSQGRATCLGDRTFGECVPPAEFWEADEATCDGRDNDCDGTADEGYTGVGMPCDTDDEDLCAYGLTVCNAAGDGTECIEDEPGIESCNGLDDDCDGTIDEDAPDAPLGARQAGVCMGRVQVCAAGVWAEPDYSTSEGYEAGEQSCDGLDNDCDGRIDAGLFAPMAERQGGVCAGLMQRCGGADGWLEPDYAAVANFQNDETRCDGRDNDCDGTVDEGVDPPPCALSLGVCAQPSAEPSCLGAQGFSECAYGPDYQREETNTCDALDNDCDGMVDEGDPCPIGRRTVRVEPGRFDMGSPPEEVGRQADEAAHPVVLTHPMLVRVTEVTQAEWLTVMGNNPSARPGADLPVEQVTWLDAVRFANALSRADGLAACYQIEGDGARWDTGYACPGWRLPSEAEWEYLARAGTVGPRWSDAAGLPLGDAAWYRDNSGNQTHPVGQREANAFGLFDVLGNVNEWVWDRAGDYPAGEVTDPVGPAAGDDRVVRGGAYSFAGALLRSANRAPTAPRTVASDIGLRVLRTAPLAAE